MLLIYSILASTITLVYCEYQAAEVSASEYSFRNHPLFVHKQFATVRESLLPVVMKRYYLTHKQFGQHSATHAIFAPRSASYIHYDSGMPFVTSADAFVVGLHQKHPTESPSEFGRIFLNHPARVFALLWSHHHFHHPPKENFLPALENVPDSWKVIGAVRTLDELQIPVGDSGRRRTRLMNRGLAVQVPVEHEQSEYIVRFPHPWSIQIDGTFARDIQFIFVPEQRVEGLVYLKSFASPELPGPFRPFRPDDGLLRSGALFQQEGDIFDHKEVEENENGLIDPKEDPPIPNHTCPEWLHDLHVTTTIKGRPWANGTSWHDEPAYWRTWHPMIDPVYWCYYDHEHGSYPGLYRPAFGYTAWKTKDEETETMRQMESHEGFKVYRYYAEDGRCIVQTVHIHASRARRFTARHHTVLFAVFNGDMTEMQAEVSFKSDYGAATAHVPGVPMPFDDAQQKIYDETRYKKSIMAYRVFNVINVTEDFPDSLNSTFKIRGDVTKGSHGILNGFYEQWRTTFPSCTAPKSKWWGAFLFDIRDPSTAARGASGTTDDNIQVMNGQAVKRALLLLDVNITFGLDHCSQNTRTVIRRREGVFYTDPYFEKTFYRMSRFRVRQFVKKGFQSILIKSGVLGASGPWVGTYVRENKTGLQHLEKATLKMMN